MPPTDRLLGVLQADATGKCSGASREFFRSSPQPREAFRDGASPRRVSPRGGVLLSSPRRSSPREAATSRAAFPHLGTICSPRVLSNSSITRHLLPQRASPRLASAQRTGIANHAQGQFAAPRRAHPLDAASEVLESLAARIPAPGSSSFSEAVLEPAQGEAADAMEGAAAAMLELEEALAMHQMQERLQKMQEAAEMKELAIALLECRSGCSFARDAGTHWRCACGNECAESSRFCRKCCTRREEAVELLETPPDPEVLSSASPAVMKSMVDECGELESTEDLEVELAQKDLEESINAVAESTRSVRLKVAKVLEVNEDAIVADTLSGDTSCSLSTDDSGPLCAINLLQLAEDPSSRCRDFSPEELTGSLVIDVEGHAVPAG